MEAGMEAPGLHGNRCDGLCMTTQALQAICCGMRANERELGGRKKMGRNETWRETGKTDVTK